MANEVQKKPSLPAKNAQGKAVAASQAGVTAPAQSLPNATIIYGIGASLLFVASLFLLLQGRWFTGFLTILVGGCLVGYALHFLKHQD
ncbi:MAG: hypothetical protein P4M15_13660 [Alphaproteobacteria bacterium]|nr:hypothetical protein [Alphaproteobacteria bacterium]